VGWNNNSGLKASVDASKEQAAGGVTDVSGALQEKVVGAGAGAVDVLRKAIVTAEDSLGSAATFVANSYGTAKDSLSNRHRRGFTGC
jgi:hypothetical protein